MKLVVGLGNPGSKYENTRHNVGFMAVDSYVHEMNGVFEVWGPGKNCELASLKIDGEKVFVLKPQTFMNLSGEAVVAVALYFKIAPEDIVVIHDEVDIPLGDVRLKVDGGEGGHNGLKSISQCLAATEYSRIRMGIGRPAHAEMDTSDHVLGNFKSSEEPLLDEMIGEAIQAINAFLGGKEAFLKEMNMLNRKKKD